MINDEEKPQRKDQYLARETRFVCVRVVSNVVRYSNVKKGGSGARQDHNLRCRKRCQKVREKNMPCQKQQKKIGKITKSLKMCFKLYH